MRWGQELKKQGACNSFGSGGVYFWVGFFTLGLVGFCTLGLVGLCTFHSIEFFPCKSTSYTMDSSFVLISRKRIVFSLGFDSERYC